MQSISLSCDGTFTVHKGDRITIQALGITVIGTVLTANYWAPPDGWYIEIALDNGGYSYWKQGLDGGEIVSVLPQS